MAQQQQVWGTPLPWALQAVAVLTACVGAVHAGLLPKTTAPLLVGILLSCSLPQLIAAIIHFRRGEILPATITGLFGTVITLGAALTLFQLITAEPPGAITPEVMSVFWFVLFIIALVYAIAFGRMSWFLMLGIAEVAVAFLLLSLGVYIVAGWLLIIFAIFCLYCSAAILWGEHFQRPVLPLGRPVFK
jgi:succinate-acetate transporter protein